MKLLLILGLAGIAAGMPLVDAIEQVESGGDCKAIGDNARAVGCMQIWPIMVKDVNRISKKKFTLNDRYSREKSHEIFKIYTNHYGKNYLKKTGQRPSVDVYCAMWCSGPNGYNKLNTKGVADYVNKVKRELERSSK